MNTLKDIFKTYGRNLDVLYERQRKVFVNFLNWKNKPHKHEIATLSDLASGVGVYYLLLAEGVNESELKVSLNRTEMDVVKVNNWAVILKYLSQFEDVMLDGIRAQTLANGDEKVIMGLVWSIVAHFHLEGGKRAHATSYKKLQKWMNKHVVPSQDKMKGMEDFATGKPMYHLIRYCEKKAGIKKLLEVDPESGDKGGIIQTCMNYAFDKFEIPMLLEVGDLLKPDEITLMVYVVCFKHYAKGKKRKRKKKKKVALVENAIEAPEVQTSGGLSALLVGRIIGKRDPYRFWHAPTRTEFSSHPAIFGELVKKVEKKENVSVKIDLKRKRRKKKNADDDEE